MGKFFTINLKLLNNYKYIQVAYVSDFNFSHLHFSGNKIS